MALPEYLLEYLHIKRIWVAAEMKISESGMKAFAVIIPIRDARELKYYRKSTFVGKFLISI